MNDEEIISGSRNLNRSQTTEMLLSQFNNNKGKMMDEKDRFISSEGNEYICTNKLLGHGSFSHVYGGYMCVYNPIAIKKNLNAVHEIMENHLIFGFHAVQTEDRFDIVARGRHRNIAHHSHILDHTDLMTFWCLVWTDITVLGGVQFPGWNQFATGFF